MAKGLTNVQLYSGKFRAFGIGGEGGKAGDKVTRGRGYEVTRDQAHGYIVRQKGEILCKWKWLMCGWLAAEGAGGRAASQRVSKSARQQVSERLVGAIPGLRIETLGHPADLTHGQSP